LLIAKSASGEKRLVRMKGLAAFEGMRNGARQFAWRTLKDLMFVPEGKAALLAGCFNRQKNVIHQDLVPKLLRDCLLYWLNAVAAKKLVCLRGLFIDAEEIMRVCAFNCTCAVG
jgi:hypothetical protein